MRTIKIVADSSANVQKLDGVDFAFAPLKIITEKKEFVDDANLSITEMIGFFDSYKGPSKTSCPNINDWIEAFGDSDDIFCVTITGGLSGSYNSACVAKKMYEQEHSGRRVFVLDSLSAGPEITLIVEKLRAMVLEGLDYDEICEQIKAYKERTGLIFMLKSLKNFAANGRVSPLVAKIVGVVGICIVGRADEKGTLEPTHKCRGESKALNTLVADLETHGFTNGKIQIGHCENEAGALALKELIQKKFPKARISISTMGALCCYYAEKGGLLVGFEK